MSFDPYFSREDVMKFSAAQVTGNEDALIKDVILWVDVDAARRLRLSFNIAPGDKYSNVITMGDLAQVAYLDVGRWGGGHSWDRNRFFGVCAGSSVFLCSFDNPGSSAFEAEWLPGSTTTKKQDDGQRVAPFLDRISRNSTTGHVTVRRATKSYVFGQKIPSNVIYVVLGDLHFPVMTYTKRIDFEAGNPIPMMGRINFEELDARLAGSLANPMHLQHVAPESKDLTLHSYKQLTEELIPRSGAEDWLEMFATHSDREGADIFEAESFADEELKSFLSEILQYNDSRTRLLPHTIVVQTGDMYELWAGLKNAGGFLHGDPNLRNKFRDFWLNEMKRHTRGNSAIDMVEHTVKATGGRILAGNHDDYMFPMLRANYRFRGIHLEHGHQADVFNNVWGRDLGWLITQAATRHPALRHLEDPFAGSGTWAIAAIGSQKKTPPRITAMRRAAGETVPVLKQSKDGFGTGTPRGVYGMGHTHRPCVFRIRVREGNPDGRLH